MAVRASGVIIFIFPISLMYKVFLSFEVKPSLMLSLQLPACLAVGSHHQGPPAWAADPPAAPPLRPISIRP